jgi:hypothetical protein
VKEGRREGGREGRRKGGRENRRKEGWREEGRKEEKWQFEGKIIIHSCFPACEVRRNFKPHLITKLNE